MDTHNVPNIAQLVATTNNDKPEKKPNDGLVGILERAGQAAIQDRVQTILLMMLVAARRGLCVLTEQARQGPSRGHLYNHPGRPMGKGTRNRPPQRSHGSRRSGSQFSLLILLQGSAEGFDPDACRCGHTRSRRQGRNFTALGMAGPCPQGDADPDEQSVRCHPAAVRQNPADGATLRTAWKTPRGRLQSPKDSGEHV